MTSMRDLISLVEGVQEDNEPEARTTPVTPEELTAAILATIKDFVGKKPRCKTVRDIGSGYCYDFVEAVFTRLGAAEDYTHETGRFGIEKGYSEEFHSEDFVADLNILKSMGEKIPRDIPRRQLENLLGSATHEWIKLNGRHYDATAPHGVDRILDMPFFADQIEGLRKEIAAKRKQS